MWGSSFGCRNYVYQSHWATLFCPIPTTSYSRALPVRFTKRCWCVTQGWMWLMNRCVSNYAAISLRCQNPVTPVKLAKGSCSGYLRNQVSAFSKSLCSTLNLSSPHKQGGTRNHLEQEIHPSLPLKETSWQDALLEQEGAPSSVLPWRYKKTPGTSTQFGNICNW